jgi:hypothetical protein
MSTSIAALTWIKANNPNKSVPAVNKPHIECSTAPFGTISSSSNRGSFAETWSTWAAGSPTADVSPGGNVTYGAQVILETGPAYGARSQLRDCANHRTPSGSIRNHQYYGGIMQCTTARLSQRNPGTAAYFGWLRGHNSAPYFVDSSGTSTANENGVCFASFPGDANWSCVVSRQRPNGVLPEQSVFLTSQAVGTGAALKIVLHGRSKRAEFFINSVLVHTVTTGFNQDPDENVDATCTVREYGVDMLDAPVAVPTLTALYRVTRPIVKMWRPGYMGTRLVHNNW